VGGFGGTAFTNTSTLVRFDPHLKMTQFENTQKDGSFYSWSVWKCDPGNMPFCISLVAI
jgi:hypothetical protein